MLSGRSVTATSPAVGLITNFPCIDKNVVRVSLSSPQKLTLSVEPTELVEPPPEDAPPPDEPTAAPPVCPEVPPTAIPPPEAPAVAERPLDPARVEAM